MSAILSTPTDTAAVPRLVNITPANLPSGEAETWGTILFAGRIYLGWLSLEADKKRDIRKILRYDITSGQWETILEKTVNFGRAMRRHSAEQSVTFAIEGDTLLVRFVSPHGLEILTSSDGVQFAAQDPGARTEPPFERHHAVTVEGTHYVLQPADGGQQLLSRTDTSGGAWSTVNSPSARPSSLHVWQNQLVLASNDSSRGFDLLTLDGSGEWKPVITRGGYRFTLDSEVFAGTPWKDAFYLAAGRSHRGPKWLQEGFELIRVYADWSWDVVIGAPRITNAGLKIPISGMGPGTNEYDPAQFCFLTAHASSLLLGTYDDVAGLRIWLSHDGDAWDTLPGISLTGSNKLAASETFQTPHHTFLALALEDLSSHRSASFWLLSAESA